MLPPKIPDLLLEARAYNTVGTVCKVQNLCNSIMIYKNLEFQNSLKFGMGFKMHFTVFLVEGFRATLKVVWSSL